MRGLILAVGLLAAVSAPALAQTPVAVREQGELVTENVPVTPPEVREALRRYSNARSAGFLDWLADGSILISTRFGQTSQVHRVTVPGGARTQLTFFDEPVAGADGRPKFPGSYIFSRDVGGAEYFQGYSANLTGPETAFTEARTRNTDFVFSPDGAQVAWSRVTPGSGDYDVMVMRSGEPESRRVALEGTGAMAPVAFSRDGSKVMVTRRISAQSSKIFVLDLASGTLSEINPSRKPIAYSGGEFTPDGKGVLVLSDEGSEVQRLVLHEIGSRRSAVVADGGAWEIERFDVSDDGRLLAYSVNEDGRSKLLVRDLITRRALPQPQLPLGVMGAMKFSQDSTKLGFGLTTATSPSDVWVWDVNGAALTRWTSSEMGGLDAKDMAEPGLIRVKSFDGRQVPAWVYRPKAAGKAPVIIDIHGGPEGQSRPTFSPTYQYFVNELGAAVVVPNVRGSTGYGKTYLSLDNGMKRRDSVKDIGALLDWIAAQPDLDAGRVVVRGGSYGGYMTLASFADYNDRLAGAIDSVGISNWLTFLANTEGYRRDLRRVEYGDERIPAMRAFLEQDSPIRHVARMKKPLFVIAGYNDPRVPWTEGRQMVDEARRNGVDVWWMMAKDEGHGFRKKTNVDALREAETLFLRKVFGGN